MRDRTIALGRLSMMAMAAAHMQALESPPLGRIVVRDGFVPEPEPRPAYE